MYSKSFPKQPLITIAMKTTFRNILIICVLISGLLAFEQKAHAQDTGAPAVRSLAFYTLGGGAGGVALGIAYWMLDPLAPGADLRGTILQGYGVGVFLGFIFGVTQLNKQAVFPYIEPTPIDEFEGGVLRLDPQPLPFVYSEGPPRKRSLEIPLFQMQYKF